ncbi:hypothetical protein T492DRAFT_854007 [Pavlovales sp. CCMP2436]|nr:hypothetical protein T492DRAFT_854007 [Pavlovales sp. CCMP2436]
MASEVITRAGAIRVDLEPDKCADAIVPNIDVLDDAQLARKTRTAVFEITLGLISLRAARVQLEFEWERINNRPLT